MGTTRFCACVLLQAGFARRRQSIYIPVYTAYSPVQYICCPSAMLPLLLLFLLGDTLAVAPGDEYDGCEVPDYPVNIKVLLDSWRYRTLHGHDDVGTADWTTVGNVTVSQNCVKYLVTTCTWLLF